MNKEQINGEWVYEDYTPNWIKKYIQKRCGIEICTIDQANHPLNPEKMNYNLNTLKQFFRYPEYPFWVRGEDIKKSLFFRYDSDKKVSNDEFLELLHEETKYVYRYFCDRWYNTLPNHIYVDIREALIIASKGL